MVARVFVVFVHIALMCSCTQRKPSSLGVLEIVPTLGVEKIVILGEQIHVASKRYPGTVKKEEVHDAQYLELKLTHSLDFREVGVRAFFEDNRAKLIEI